jgi:hypothetical protein
MQCYKNPNYESALKFYILTSHRILPSIQIFMVKENIFAFNKMLWNNENTFLNTEKSQRTSNWTNGNILTATHYFHSSCNKSVFVLVVVV